MRDRRIGKFSLHRHLLDECPDCARAILRDVIVLRAEAMWHADRIDYVGVHPSFAIKEDGEDPPEYDAEIEVRGDGTVDVERVTWKMAQ